MAEICCGVVNSEGESPGCETISSRAARRRRMEIRRFRFVAGVSTTAASTATDSSDGNTKRQRTEISTATSFPRECVTNAAAGGETSGGCCGGVDEERETVNGDTSTSTSSSCADGDGDNNDGVKDMSLTTSVVTVPVIDVETSSEVTPKFGVASVCGRRRDMEDAVVIRPSFYKKNNVKLSELHYYAVYDGHGCSHVATRCKERLHEIVKEEIVSEETAVVPEWRVAMERSFGRMDKEVVACNQGVAGNCRCELQTPECDAVGSTAVVAVVTPDKIIVANCGDSRAVLCRNGKAVPLSSDHKPDRPDELNRIQEAGGRVIYWDGPRVLGVLAMSRAIGDNYLKPYVSCEPEVTITDRTADDDCLILASDGLWDVVSNDTACGVARMCLRGKIPSAAAMAPEVEGFVDAGEGKADKACSDASMLLTKLALARRSADNVSVVVIDLRKDT